MKEIKVRVTLTEEMLGMCPADPEVYDTYIASSAPTPDEIEEELDSFAPGEKGMTIFPKLKDGTPFIWNYQVRGMFKDACGMLRRVEGTKSSKVKAYKKIIDGTIFVEPRKIAINVAGEMGTCQRPLRASTPQGERVALAKSETIPEGSWFDFTVKCLVDSDEKLVEEWLGYCSLRGFGQWRNSGKGTATYAIME